MKPGDRVAIAGIYRALAGGGSTSNGNFKTVLLANSVRRTSKETGNVTLSVRRYKSVTLVQRAHVDVHDPLICGAYASQAQDISHIRELAARPDIFNLMSRSLAPSIYGHKFIKQVCPMACASL